MKHLNQEEKRAVSLNLIANDKWIEHYKKLWYDRKVFQRDANKTGEVQKLLGTRRVSFFYEEALGNWLDKLETAEIFQ